jgi:hypothetical protein
MDAFQSRVADVFGALDHHNPYTGQPAWCVNSAIVPQRGNGGESGSDDGDGDHVECIKVRLMSAPGVRLNLRHATVV